LLIRGYILHMDSSFLVSLDSKIDAVFAFK
jgi:hypothetical protein